MKKAVIILVFFGVFQGFSQEDAWVYFVDKPNFQAYFDAPLLMLSQRSLDRRTAQSIALDMKDVPIFQTYIDQVVAANGILVRAKSKWFNALHVVGSQQDIASLSALSFVDHIEYANHLLNIGGKNTVVSNFVRPQKTFETTTVFDYGNSQNQISMLNGQLLHEQNFTGAGKIVAVMDAGFPGVNTIAPFARLRDNNLILGGYDFVNRTDNFYNGFWHGTSVLSTMGGFVEGQLVGTAPDAGYYLFITEDVASEGPIELSLWVEAAEEADRLGADIITTSLGYTTFDNPAYDFTYNDMNGTSTFISRGLEIAFSRGMVCVNSAGNEGDSLWHYISAPADAEHALAVGAVTPNGSYAVFSSQGPTFDGRVKPDVVAQGQAAVVSDEFGNISLANGTSFSGPIVAGMVASFWQALPGKTNTELMQLIKEASSQFANPDETLGYGIPNFDLALTTALQTTSMVKNQVVVHPNPAKSNIFFDFDASETSADLRIYDQLGHLILYQTILNNEAIDVKKWASGLYFYELKTTFFSKRGKILKN